MALFASTKKTIERTGTNIPIPFSEISISPGRVSDQYTKTPSKIKFNNILTRPRTNWSFLFLNKNIVTKDKTADPKYKARASRTSSTYTGCPASLLHKETKNIKTPLNKKAINKYTVWIRCNILSLQLGQQK